MKIFGLVLSLIFATSLIKAQPAQPVEWTFSAHKVADKEYDLQFTATIEPGWFIYSQKANEDGPIPTSFYFTADPGFEPVGIPKEEGEKKEGMDDIFGIHLIKYAKKATFTQRVMLTEEVETISGYLEFMCCNDKQCLPPSTIDFVFNFKK
ncbi:MAG: protein-disulfide reductase DsbD family protein [Saprospiraceae bacterium]